MRTKRRFGACLRDRSDDGRGMRRRRSGEHCGDSLHGFDAPTSGCAEAVSCAHPAAARWRASMATNHLEVREVAGRGNRECWLVNEAALL